VEGIPVSGVSELVLHARDLAAAERFYAEVLGLPVVERWDDPRAAVWVMAGDRTRIGLWGHEGPGIARGRGGAHVHFAMHIEPADLEPAIERLRAHGLDVELTDFGDHGRSAYVTDPDGNVVELWTWDVAEHLTSS
jgi:catechol 2,3-dioxygenase-like lactoylglutathione lyase family enzyme